MDKVAKVPSYRIKSKEKDTVASEAAWPLLMLLGLRMIPNQIATVVQADIHLAYLKLSQTLKSPIMLSATPRMRALTIIVQSRVLLWI